MPATHTGTRGLWLARSAIVLAVASFALATVDLIAMALFGILNLPLVIVLARWMPRAFARLALPLAVFVAVELLAALAGWTGLGLDGSWLVSNFGSGGSDLMDKL